MARIDIRDNAESQIDEIVFSDNFDVIKLDYSDSTISFDNCWFTRKEAEYFIEALQKGLDLLPVK